MLRGTLILITVLMVVVLLSQLGCTTTDRRYDWSENNIGREFQRQGIIE